MFKAQIEFAPYFYLQVKVSLLPAGELQTFTVGDFMLPSKAETAIFLGCMLSRAEGARLTKAFPETPLQTDLGNYLRTHYKGRG